MNNFREIKLTYKIIKNMIIYYASYKLAKEIFDSSFRLWQSHTIFFVRMCRFFLNSDTIDVFIEI